jgi:hypothetical protein
MPECGVKKCAALFDRIAHEGLNRDQRAEIRDQAAGNRARDYRIPAGWAVNWLGKRVKVEF